jgi:hypothetical protein
MTRFDRTDIRRRAVALLDQQLWCWGQDVTRPGGNVLLELGLCRYRPSDGRGSTAYTGRVAGNGMVWLWGFGLLFWQSDLGGVFLRRYGFDPVLVTRLPQQPVHTPEQLEPLCRPGAAHARTVTGTLVRAAAEWVAGYEHWVSETHGTAYREVTLAALNKPPAVPARDMARAWNSLAKKSHRLTSSDKSRSGPWSRLFAALQSHATNLDSARPSVRFTQYSQRVRIA